MHRKLLVLGIVLAVGIIVAACGGGAQPTATPTATTPKPTPTKTPTATQAVTVTEAPPGPTAGVALGRSIFTGEAGVVSPPCTACHMVGTQISGGPVGPDLDGLGSRAATQKSGLGAEEYIRESVVDPGAFVVGSFSPIMPSGYGDQLSAEQLDALVQFLLSLE